MSSPAAEVGAQFNERYGLILVGGCGILGAFTILPIAIQQMKTKQ